MHRKSADYLLRRTTNLIKAYNADESNPLKVTRMVVFGSYANTDKEMLSDLDLALGWEYRKEGWDAWIDLNMDDMLRFYKLRHEPDIVRIIQYMEHRALIYFRQRSAFIQFTTLNIPEE